MGNVQPSATPAHPRGGGNPPEPPRPKVGNRERAGGRAYAPPPNPRVVLAPPEPPLQPREWEHPQEILRTGGRWRVTGPPGSGLSALAVDTFLAALEKKINAADILVIAPSKEAAGRLRADVARRVDPAVKEQPGYIATGARVRSVHALAFSIISETAHAALGPAPRLLTGAEHDVIVRQLLAGHVEDDGGARWPEEIRPALELDSFAADLRDFLLRAQERGVSAQQMASLGARFNRPLWVAAAQFQEEYDQVMALEGRNRLNAAQMLTTAIAALDAYPEYERQLAQRIRVLIVDDAQDLDPFAGMLVTRLAAHAQVALIAGDTQRGIFGFRGADPDFFMNMPVDHQLQLPASRRQVDSRTVMIADSPEANTTAIAQVCRQRHLLDGIAWDNIAVITRSVGDVEPLRRALLGAGVPVRTDPTAQILAEEPLVQDLFAAAAATYRRLSPEGVEKLAIGLVGGSDPVVFRRVLRGIRRMSMSLGLQERSAEVIAAMVAPPQATYPATAGGIDAATWWEHAAEFLAPRELEVLEHLRSILAAGAAAMSGGASVEEVLWELWAAAGLAEPLRAQSLRGGAAGAQADHELDTIIALFDRASDYVATRPRATFVSFMEDIRAEKVPTGARDRRLARPEAVDVLTAHAAVGREWDTVIVAGVQEGSWPSFSATGTLFGQEELTDYLDDGIIPGTPVSHVAERLRAERRLFDVACSRATTRLIVTAVDAPDSDAAMEMSRFVHELIRSTHVAVQQLTRTPDTQDAPAASRSSHPETVVTRVQRSARILSPEHTVAELRRAAADQDAPHHVRMAAVRQLVRLARAGIPGAHPEQWWGILPPSTSWEHGDSSKPVLLSASGIEKVVHCPLRAVLQDNIRIEHTGISQQRGTLLHALVELFGRLQMKSGLAVNAATMDAAQQLARLKFAELLTGPNWAQQRALEHWDATVSRLLQTARLRVLTGEPVGVEIPFSVDLFQLPSGQQVGLRGTIDRLERTLSGALAVVDWKTGTHVLSAAAVSDDIQLQTYQMALSHGHLVTGDNHPSAAVHITTVAAGDEPLEVDSASLIYPAANVKFDASPEQPQETRQLQDSTVPVRTQARMSTEQEDSYRQLLANVVAATHGPTLVAQRNNTCAQCGFATMCPAVDQGRPATDV